jgi:hypothetical protein
MQLSVMHFVRRTRNEAIRLNIATLRYSIPVVKPNYGPPKHYNLSDLVTVGLSPQFDLQNQACVIVRMH